MRRFAPIQFAPSTANDGLHPTAAFRTLTLMMVGLAAAATAWTRDGAADRPWRASLPPIGWTFIAAAIGWAMARQSATLRLPLYRLLQGAVPPLLLAIPPACWLAARSGDRGPLELVLLTGCRNGMLAMAALASTRRQFCMAVGVSLFLVTLASMRIAPPLAAPLLAMYAATGCVWLCWDQMQATATRVGSIAAALAVATVTVVSCRIAIGFAGDNRASARHGWLASSGGTGAGNAAASEGIGDGPDEVAGSTHARSIGFDQSNTFMNSERAGLYDAFLETFGAPAKTKDVVKMQMLRVQDIQAAQTTSIDDYRNGRQFSLSRLPPTSAAKATAHAADALLFVRGELPLHLRLDAFDQLDGDQWMPAVEGWSQWSLQHAANDPTWFVPVQTKPFWNWKTTRAPGEAGPMPFTGTRTVRVRVGTLSSDALPLPAGVQRLHMGRVTRASLLGWKCPDVPCMVERSVPVGTVIDAEYATLDPAMLTPWSWAAPLPQPRPVTPLIAQLARRWTSGVGFGWDQIAAITDHLRRDYVLDRSFRSSGSDPLVSFLTVDHRGPDYLFASAATLILRSLGYPARLAGGFYASDAAVNPATGEAALSARDLHFWAEVLVSDRWAVVEAAPGYFVAVPQRPWLTAHMLSAYGAFREHVFGIATGSVLVLLAFLFRIALLDLIATARVRLSSKRDPLTHAQRTATLLQRRATLAGLDRPPSQTFRRWVSGSQLPLSAESRIAAQRLAEFTTWADFGPAERAPWSADEIRTVCNDVCRNVSAKRLRRLSRSRQPNGGRIT